MTPRYSTVATRRPAAIQRGSSLEAFRENDAALDEAARAWWSYATAPLEFEGGDPVDALLDVERRALSKSTSGGGYLVPSDLADQIVAASRAAGVLQQLALEIVTSDGGTLGVPTVATHGAATWTGENIGYTATDEVATQASLGAFKVGALQVVSEELVRDAEANFDSYLASELGLKLGAAVETALITGSGTDRPLGITNAGSGYTVSTAPTGNATSFTAAAIQQFYLALPAAYRSQASWIVAADDYAKLVALADTSASFTSLGFDSPSMYGRPVLVSGDMPSPAANAISLAFGAWPLAYCLRRVNGVAIQRLDEKFSDSGQVGFKAYMRVDGRPLLAAAAILGKHSAT